MSDISLHFTIWDLIIAAPIFGWPGLLIGGGLGALWKQRRILGIALGAVVGCVLWFTARIML